MRKYLTLLTLWLCPAVLVAQKHYNPVAGAYQYDRLGTTNVLSIPHGCGFPVSVPVTDAGKTNMYLDTCAHALYHYDALGGWRRVVDSGVTVIDTISEIYDTVNIFNYTPSGTSLPAGFGGTAAHTVSGGLLTFSGHTSSTWLDSTYIVDSIGTLTEGAIMTARLIYNTVTTTDTGISIGWMSTNPYTNESVFAGYAFNQGGYFGSAVVPVGSAYTFGSRVPSGFNGVALSSTQQPTISAGDVVKYTLVKTGINYGITVFDSTQGWTVATTTVTNPLSQPYTANNTAYPAIFWHGGGFSVSNWKYSIIKPHHCDLAIEGNSITYGQAAVDQNAKWANLVGIRKNNVISGGGTDVSASVRMRTAEILKTGAAHAAIMIGGNDILLNVAVATWQSNLRHIRDTLTANGVSVIWLYPTPRTGLDVRPLVNFLDTAVDFANDKKIRGTFYGLLDPNSVYGMNPIYNVGLGDGTHPNDLGHFTIASIINDSLVLWGYLSPLVNSHEFNQVIVQGGRRAGQAIFGANTDGGSLFLGSTTSGNKGYVNIANGAYFTDQNGFAGFGGNRAPQYPLDVSGPVVSSYLDPTVGGTEYSARFQAAYAYRGSGYGYAVVDPSSPNSTITGLVISGHPGTATGTRLELSTNFSPTGGEASNAYNFYINQYASNGLISMFTTNNSGGAVPLIVMGPTFGPYAAVFDLVNNRVGLNNITTPLYSLDVRDHINGFTEPAGTNNTLMASTAFVTLDNAIANNSSTTHNAQWTGGSYITINGSTYVMSNGVFAQLGAFDSLTISGVTGGPPLFHIEQNGVANYVNNYGSLFVDHSLPDIHWVDSATIQNQNASAQTANYFISGSGNMNYFFTRNATIAGGATHWSMQNGNTQRWTIGLANSESGSNTGSDWYIGRANDAGTPIDFPLSITRSTGIATFMYGVTIHGPLLGDASTPSIAAGAGAGTSPTVTMTGSQVAGTITITTGSSPSASSAVATITVAHAYPTKVILLITPASTNAALLSGTSTMFVNPSSSTTTTATIFSGSTALGAGSTFVYSYQIAGY